jgi:hypothetical protein
LHNERQCYKCLNTEVILHPFHMSPMAFYPFLLELLQVQLAKLVMEARKTKMVKLTFKKN